jgi:hypothetical protein
MPELLITSISFNLFPTLFQLARRAPIRPNSRMLFARGRHANHAKGERQEKWFSGGKIYFRKRIDEKWDGIFSSKS